MLNISWHVLCVGRRTWVRLFYDFEQTFLPFQKNINFEHKPLNLFSTSFSRFYGKTKTHISCTRSRLLKRIKKVLFSGIRSGIVELLNTSGRDWVEDKNDLFSFLVIKYTNFWKWIKSVGVHLFIFGFF